MPGVRIAIMELASTVLDLANSEDAASIARLSRDEIERGLDWRWRPPAIRRLIAAPEVAVLCARCRIESSTENLVLLGGFGVMEFGLDRAHLVLLAVEPRLRRRGLARRMLRWLEKSARTAGIGEIDLEVRADNSGARQFYLVEGFSRGEYLPGYYQGRAAAYRMNKKLGFT
ncbi:MAG: GNAT family N-acetyltransferase [Gammaproteobacteria bacterium]|nr:GNAT family N-acetyltransferase [Gammaproteobacteria bacterium]